LRLRCGECGHDQLLTVSCVSQRMAGRRRVEDDVARPFLKHRRPRVDFSDKHQATISRFVSRQGAPEDVGPAALSGKRIAAPLDVPMSRFFVDQTRRLDLSYVPAGKGLKIARVDAVAGYTYQLLGHLLSGKLFVEPYLVTLTDEARPYAAFQHPGTKFIHMVSGRMKYRYGSHTLELKPGDSLLYDARALHGAEILRERPIAYLSIVFTLRE
jgi:Cupin domain